MEPPERPRIDHVHRVRLGRIAGWLYLVIIVCGVGGEGLVRAPMVDLAEPAETAGRLASATSGFRLSILLDVVMALADVGLAVVLFVLFEPVSRLLSLAAMAFRLVQSAILGLNLVHLHQAAALASSRAPGAVRDPLLVATLDAHAAGYDLGLFFFGVNCLLVGALVRRAPALPGLLGVGLGAAGVVYLVGSTLRIAAPGAVDTFAVAYVVPLVAELWFCVRLITKGMDAPLPAGHRVTAG